MNVTISGIQVEVLRLGGKIDARNRARHQRVGGGGTSLRIEIGVAGATVFRSMWRPLNLGRRRKMEAITRVAFTILVVFVMGCKTGHLYPADSSTVLVQPTQRAWVKSGSSMEDENRARKECGEELRNNEEVRRKGALSDDWSAAARACMNRRGFYKRR